MPISPKYYRQSKLPGRLGAGFASPRVFTADERALGEMGQVIQHRGFQLKAEHDRARAIEEFSAFSDMARKKLSELLAHESGAAVGLGGKYDEWYNEASADFLNKRLSSGNQQAFFDARATAARQEDLDILARHEANQHKVFRKESQLKGYATAREEIIKNPFNIDGIEEKIAAHLEEIDTLNQGHDNTAAKNAARATLYVDAIEAQINDDPGGAKTYLEKWKKIIGPEEYARLSAKLKAGAVAQNIDTAHARLEEMFGTDSESKLKYIKQRKNWETLGLTNVSEKQRLQNIINGEYNQDKAFREEAEKERDEQDLLAFQDALVVDKNVKNAWHIANQMQNPSVRGKALALVENQKFASDPELYTELKSRVNLDPASMNLVKIWSYLPSSPGDPGVNVDDLQSIAQRWESLMRASSENPEKYEVYKRMQKEIAKLTFPGDTDAEAITNRLAAADTLEEWFLSKGKDLSYREIEDTFYKIIEEARDDTITEWFTNLFQVGREFPGTIEERQPLRQKAIRLLLRAGKKTTQANIDEVVKRLYDEQRAKEEE